MDTFVDKKSENCNYCIASGDGNDRGGIINVTNMFF